MAREAFGKPVPPPVEERYRAQLTGNELQELLDKYRLTSPRPEGANPWSVETNRFNWPSSSPTSSPPINVGAVTRVRIRPGGTRNIPGRPPPCRPGTAWCRSVWPVIPRASVAPERSSGRIT